ncbi:MAG TPA: DUF805 domain-containing protein [Caulobacteraceae bacterium]|nr:DUF805 domain-containing protein [Caulobacteraceae bacterium]
MPIGQLLFSFEGRIRRLHWWLARLAVGAVVGMVFVLLAVVAAALGASAHEGSTPSEAAAGAIGIVFGLAMLILLPLVIWIELALTAKRWHDRDKPAVMVLIVFIPLVGPLWTVIECGFMDGTQGPNQYGPSPKGIGGPSPAQVFA